MAIPLLEYSPSSQNQRVEGYVQPGDEQSRIFSAEYLYRSSDLDELIEAAYRQMFFYAFEADRETFLESQLRSGQITVRDFIRGLALSDTYRRSFYNLNNNYRFVEQCVQRILGRDVYSEREKIAWSIVIGTKGLNGFIDALVSSDEYLEAFGDDIVPYQRRRILPSQTEGVRPFNLQSPRYDEYYRGKLGFPQILWQNEVRRYTPQEKQPKSGSPALYLDMARSLNNAKGNQPPQFSATNIDYTSKVPYRKVTN